MDELSSRLHPKAQILYRDTDVLVVCKPHGVLSHPSEDRDRPSSLFQARYDLSSEQYFLAHHTLSLMHRLDKETSGCVLLAFNQKSAKRLRAAFQAKEIDKTYVALVKGTIKSKTQWKDHLIKKDGAVFRDKTGAPNAFTTVCPLRAHESSKISYLELRPSTGKTHQLRVQAASRGLPIVGDRRYGDFELNAWVKNDFGISRMCLHALRLSFKHPVSSKNITIEAPDIDF